MKKISCFILYAVMMCVLPSVLFGQGILSGVVTDSTTGDGLIGANVIVLGTSLGSATDRDGKFRIPGIPAGQRTVRISYIGYNAKKIDVLVTGGEKSINVLLAPEAIEGQVVEVYGQLRGQMAAINQQVSSNTIVNVVSEEKIQELPDANAAEAIGHLPGVSVTRSGGEATGIVLRGMASKFANITMDGVKIPPTDPDSRDVDLSMFSQGSLGGIELFKTLTPDQDADAIAGTINFVTKKASSERSIRVDLKGGYNDIMKSTNQYDFSARYGERFFDDLIGIQIQANTEKKIRSDEQLNYTYTQTPNPQLPVIPGYDPNQYFNDININQFQAQFTDETRKRDGGQIILDVNTPDSGNVKINGMIARTDKNSFFYQKTYGNVWNYVFEQAENILTTRNIALDGKNYLLGLTLDWSASFAESETKNPNDYRAIFNESHGNSGAVPTIRTGAEQFMSIAANNFAAATLDSSELYKVESYDKENTYQLNISKNISILDMLTDKIKLGAKYKQKSRFKTSFGYGWNDYAGGALIGPNGTAEDLTGTPFAGSQDNVQLSRFYTQIATRNLMGPFVVTPIIDANIFQQWEGLKEHSTTAVGFNSGILGLYALGDYAVDENVGAAYLMNTFDVGQSATLMLGVRMESEQNNYNARFTNQASSGTGVVQTLPLSAINDTLASYRTVQWLPNVQLTLKPTDFLTVRLAAYKAIARPDFNWRLPQFFINLSGSRQSMTVGNTQLEDASAWNFELSTQLYANSFGLITLSAFDHRIDNLFHATNNLNITFVPGQTTQMMVNGVIVQNDSVSYHTLDNALSAMGLSQWVNTPTFNNYLHNGTGGYQLTAPYNSPQTSSVWGFEYEHQMNFSFLPVTWLQNVTLTYNFTLTRSETYVYLLTQRYDSLWIPPVHVGPVIQPGHTSGTLVEYPTLQKKPMEDQPQAYGNVALGYDIGGFSGRLSMFYQGQYTTTYSGDGTNDVVVGEFIKWDIALKQQLTSRISIMLNVNNIFNRQESRFRYNNIYTDWGYLPTRAELYGTTADFGVRIQL